MPVQNPVSTTQADSVTGHPIEQKSTSNAAWVEVRGNAAYPAGAVAVTAASGNVANASAVATIPAVAGKTAYLTGYEITGAGATAGLPVIATVVGLITGTVSHIVVAAAGALVANVPVIVEYGVAVPASAVNIDIVVTVPAFGAGNTHSTVVSHGYYI